MLTTMLHGFLMALADSVPGVSGGTIAFIMGFYERFLGAVSGFFGTDTKKRKAAIRYLLKFIFGWALGMGSSVLILARVFEENIYFMSSLFFGLTLCAIPFILYEERDTLKGSLRSLPFALIGLALVVLLTVFRAGFSGIGNLNFRSLNILQYIYLVIAGALAISAMLLPGISGSTLLLIFGVYVPLISAVKELLHFHLQYLPGVMAVALGVLLGVIFASKGIRRALQSHRCQTVYLILGLMAGSLYAIIMGPTTLDLPKPPLAPISFHFAAFLLGIAILSCLEWIRYMTENRPSGKDRLPA